MTFPNKKHTQLTRIEFSLISQSPGDFPIYGFQMHLEKEHTK